MAGMYLHIPFCKQRCTYCDFYFVTTARSHAPFVRSLCMEVAHYGLHYGTKEPIGTIYYGGGTPSRLALEDFHRIALAVDEAYDTSSVEEVTVEVNPEDVDGPYLRGLLELGATRLSIGVQSFFSADLKTMNRSHSVDEADRVIELAKDSKLPTYSVDLIFGVPNQPVEYWAASLEKAVAHGVPHLSTYGLTVEPATPLFRQIRDGEIEARSEDEMHDLYRFTMKYLRDAGYEHYEISSFALPGHRAIHNQSYWSHDNYLGFGPSAHSFWWDRARPVRWANIRNLRRYQALIEGRHEPIEMKEELDAETLANEHIMLRLRMSDGLDLTHLEDRYGIDLYDERVDDLAWLESEGLIEPIRNDRVVLSDDGKTLCDMVTSKLMLG